MQNKTVLFVMTGHDALGDTGQRTGFWLEEFASPYYALRDAGISVDIATPEGNEPPIDPHSLESDAMTDTARRFLDDDEAKMRLRNPIALADVSHEDYDAVFYPGGHGPLWDLAENSRSKRLISQFYDAKKPVASVCHGPAVLGNVKTPDGEYLVAGKRVTGFSNAEERAVELEDVVPFSLEDRLKKRGAQFTSGEPWAPHVEEDGHLITGQNPSSSALVAARLVGQLNH